MTKRREATLRWGVRWGVLGIGAITLSACSGGVGNTAFEEVKALSLTESVQGEVEITTPAKPCAVLEGGKPCVEVGFKFDPTFNPFLSGMPNGTVAIAPSGETEDVSDERSDVHVAAPFVLPGSVLEFAVTGSTNNNPSPSNYTPDGNSTYIFTRASNFPAGTKYENNIAFLKAPSNALVGVFLGPNSPNLTPAPVLNETDCPSDASTAAARDRAEYRPKLQQLFFIGDGKTGAGVVQKFIVPAGATRLFLANQDTFEWNNNWGTFAIELKSTAK